MYYIYLYRHSVNQRLLLIILTYIVVANHKCCVLRVTLYDIII